MMGVKDEGVELVVETRRGFLVDFSFHIPSEIAKEVLRTGSRDEQLYILSKWVHSNVTDYDLKTIFLAEISLFLSNPNLRLTYI